MDDTDLMKLCHAVADAVGDVLSQMDADARRGRGTRPGQYALDLVADAAALRVLEESGIGVLSEESGLHRSESRFVAVIDPVDGSTNASLGIPYYATSICILDGGAPRAAVVENLATKNRYEAVMGGGARKDGEPITPSSCIRLRDAIVSLCGFPSRYLGWAQFRSLGAAALELCAVADGSLDAFTVAGGSHIAPWDYMGAMLVCCESGALVSELDGRDLTVMETGARRAVAAASTVALMDELRSAWKA